MTIHSRHSFETHTTGFTDWTNSQNLVNRKTDHLLNPLASLGFLNSAPVSASNGDAYLDSSSYYVYDGGTWYQYSGIEAGIILDTLTGIVWAWNGSTYINFGSALLASVSTLPPNAIYNGIISNPALFFANTLAVVNSAVPNISVTPAGLASWWANTLATQLQNATLAEARTGTNATKIINPDDLKAVFHFGSGVTPPSGAPASQSEGFYHDTLTNSYYVYDYVSASWKNLTDSATAYSEGVSLPSTPTHGYIFHNISAGSLGGVPSGSYAIYNSLTTNWDVIGRETFSASATAPSSPLNNDLWQNTATSTISGVPSGALAYWDGATWNIVHDQPSKVYKQATAPTSPNLYDLWRNTSISTVSGVGSRNLAFWNGSTWIQLAGDKTFLEVRNTSSQVFSGASTYTKKVFNTIISDSSSGWNAVLNEYTIQEDGIYVVNVGAPSLMTSIGVTNAGTVIWLYVNGSIQTRISSGIAWSPANGSVLGSFPVGSITKRFLSGDIVSIYHFNGTAVSSATSLNGLFDSFLTISKIGEL